MKPLVTFTEDFHLNLLPRVIQDVDEKGYIRSVVGGWQDRMEELRALVDQYATLIDPLADQALNPNCLIITFTSSDGKVVRRAMFLNALLDPAVAILNNPNADKSVLIGWAESALDLKDGVVTNVELGYNPRMAIASPTLGLLAKTLGVMPLPDGVDTATLRRVTQNQLAWSRAKGTPRALANRLYALGFTDVLFTPLWSRLSPRSSLSPLEKGVFQDRPPAEFDLSGTPDTWPESSDYEPSALRDGPFALWEEPCSLLDPSAFYTSINNSSPFIRVKFHGLNHANHRRAWNNASEYLQGDVVVHEDQAYIAKSFPAGEPGTTSASGWAELYPPDPGSYLLDGGAENVKATVTLTSTVDDEVVDSGLTVEAIAPGASFNGLEVLVSDWVKRGQVEVTNFLALQHVTFGNFGSGTFRLSYVNGAWTFEGGADDTWLVTQPLDLMWGSPAAVSIRFYSGMTKMWLPEIYTDGGMQVSWHTEQAAHDGCRDLQKTFTHSGGEIYVESKSFDMGFGEQIPGQPGPTFKLEQQSTEERSISVYDRLSSIKYRSSHFDVIVAAGEMPSQPVQPNEALRDNPQRVWPYTATAPFRPFGGNSAPLIQVPASETQLDESKLQASQALAASAVEDWRPATRTPRRVEVGIVLDDTFRVAPYTKRTKLFTTDGSTSKSGTATDPLPPKLPTIDLSGTPIIECPVATAMAPLALPNPGGFPLPETMCFDPLTGYLWISDSTNEWIWVVDGATNTFLRYVHTTPYGDYGTANIKYDPINRQMVLLTWNCDLIFINPDTYELIAAIPNVTNEPSTKTWDLDYDHGRVMVVPRRNPHPNPLLNIIDCATHTIIHSEPMPYGVDAITWCSNVGKFATTGDYTAGCYRLYDPDNHTWFESSIISTTTYNYECAYIPATGHLLQTQDGAGGRGTRVINITNDTQITIINANRIGGITVDTCSSPNHLWIADGYGYLWEYSLPSYAQLLQEWHQPNDVKHSRRTNDIYYLDFSVPGIGTIPTL